MEEMPCERQNADTPKRIISAEEVVVFAAVVGRRH